MKVFILHQHINTSSRSIFGVYETRSSAIDAMEVELINRFQCTLKEHYKLGLGYMEITEHDVITTDEDKRRLPFSYSMPKWLAHIS